MVNLKDPLLTGPVVGIPSVARLSKDVHVILFYFYLSTNNWITLFYGKKNKIYQFSSKETTGAIMKCCATVGATMQCHATKSMYVINIQMKVP